MKFSVLMPLYIGTPPNSFLKAIKSVFDNTLCPDEIVLICDGPLASGHEKIISNYIESGLLNVVRLDENLGIVSALNIGLKKCKNNLVVRCDADDQNQPNRFSTLIDELVEDPSLAVLGSSIQELDERRSIVRLKKAKQSHGEIVQQVRVRNPMNHMTVAYRRDLVLAVGSYPDISKREDYGLWIKMLAAGFKFKNLSDPLVMTSSGDDMYCRRRGLDGIKGEFEIYKMLVSARLGMPFWSFFIFMGRSFALSLPSKQLGWVYKLFLRETKSECSKG